VAVACGQAAEARWRLDTPSSWRTIQFGAGAAGEMEDYPDLAGAAFREALDGRPPGISIQGLKCHIVPLVPAITSWEPEPGVGRHPRRPGAGVSSTVEFSAGAFPWPWTTFGCSARLRNGTPPSGNAC
jgi:hypothetical protein